MAKRENGRFRIRGRVIGNLVQTLDNNVKEPIASLARSLPERPGVIERQGAQPVNRDALNLFGGPAARKRRAEVVDRVPTRGQAPEYFVDMSLGPTRFRVQGIAFIQEQDAA